MAGDLKTQIAVGVDGTGVSTGVEGIKRKLGELGAAAAAAGKKASEGLDGAGKGAGDQVPKIDAATRGIVQAIERTRIAVAAGAKGNADYFESFGALRGADMDVLRPYIAQLRQAETQAKATADAQRKLAESASFLSGLEGKASSIGKSAADLAELKAAQLGVSAQAAPFIAKMREADQAIGKTGVSAGQTAAALRQVPAQFTDIFVSLQSGQAPLTVLLQQGGQLKDMFGGIGPAARAMGGYVLGLVNPFTVAAAAIGGLVYATLQAEGSARNMATLSVQLAATGRASILTTDQLKALIDQMARLPGVTKDAAREAVSEFTKAPAIGLTLFRDLSASVADFARATGTDIPTAARTLATAFSDPAKGADLLSESLGALTASQRLTIDEMVAVGNTSGAQRVLLDGLRQSVEGLAKEGVTPLQAATNNLGNAWTDTMRAFNNSDALKAANSQLTGMTAAVAALVRSLPAASAAFQNAFSKSPGSVLGAVGNSVLDALPFGRMIGMARTASPGADARTPIAGAASVASAASAAAGPSVGAAAGLRGSVDELDKEVQAVLKLTNSYKSLAGQRSDLNRDAETIRTALGKLRDKGRGDSKEAEELQDRLAGVQERISKLGKSGAAAAAKVARADLKSDIQGFKDDLAGMVGDYGRAERLMESQRSAGLLDEASYYAAKRQFIEQNVAAKIAEIDQENARMRSEKASGAERIDLDRQIEMNLRRRTELQKDAANATQILAGQEETANRARAASYLAARQAAESYLETMQKQQDRDVAALGQGERARQLNAGRSQIEDRYEQQRRDAINRRQLLEAEGKFNPDAEKKYDQEMALIAEFQAKALSSYEAYWTRLRAGEADWTLGAAQAIANYRDESANVFRQVEQLTTNAFKGMEDALVSFATTGKADFKSLANSIIADLVRIQVRASIASVFGGGAGGLSSLIGSVSGGLSGSSAASVANVVGGSDKLGSMISLMGLTQNALGGVYSSPGLSAYSNKIVDKPTIFPFAKGIGLMGEAGEEAIMPLRRGSDGRLGVAASGGAGGIEVHVHNNGAPASAQVTQTRKADGGMRLDVVLEQFEDALADRVGNGSGSLARAFEGRYGARTAVN